MNHRRRNEYLGADDPPLTDFRADSELERKLGWSDDLIVCRECGQKRASIATTHLRFHELSFAEYREKWPGAPMLSRQTHAAVKRAAVKYERANPEQHQQRAAKWRSDPKNAPKLKAQNERATARRRMDPEPHRAYDRSWYVKKKIPRATEAQLLRFQENPSSLPFVVCLEPGCRARLRDIGCAHLAKIHGMSPEAYMEKHPGMPIKVAHRKKPGRPGYDELRAHIRELRDAGVKKPEIAKQLGLVEEQRRKIAKDQGIKVGQVNFRDALDRAVEQVKYYLEPTKKVGRKYISPTPHRQQLTPQ